MKVIVSPRAEKELRKIAKIYQIAIIKKLRSLASSPVNKEKLAGYKDIYRIRLGHYRIVYRQTKEQIFIILIGHRKDIYRVLNQLIRK